MKTCKHFITLSLASVSKKSAYDCEYYVCSVILDKQQ